VLPRPRRIPALPGYAELVCRSNFSFLTGASHPEELVGRAQALRYAALAITDECSLGGVVRAHGEAKRLGLPLIVGATMQLAPRSTVSGAGAASARPSARPASAFASTPASTPALALASASTRTPTDPPTASQSAARRHARSSPTAAPLPRKRVAIVPPTATAPGDATSVTPTAHPAPGPRLVLLAQTRRGYGNLSQWITVARRRAAKGAYLALMGDLEGKVPDTPTLAGLPDCLALLMVGATAQPGEEAWGEMASGPAGPADAGDPAPFETLFAHAVWLKTWFGPERCALALPLLLHPHDALLVELTQRVANLTGLRIVAVGDVLMHTRSRKPLQDALTATRLRRPVADCGHALASNAEQHLRSRARLASLYRPEWLAATLELAGSCRFSLDELRYEYPEEIVPAGHTPASWLRQLTEEGLRRRFPAAAGASAADGPAVHAGAASGVGADRPAADAVCAAGPAPGHAGTPPADPVPPTVRATIEHELALIAQLQYEPYFLTVADLVHWARGQGILCQGRGSAANSAVCYALGVTEVDPARMSLLFERFISAERNEPPDIDIDFEHQRREEVIQYVYRKYGRHRAALTGVVISYRPRSALRDVGRALGIDLDRIDAVSKGQHWFDGRSIAPERLREHGFDPDAPLCRLWVELTQALIGFPRHLSQHPGGFVIARDQLARLVPVENAAMEGRSVIQWDKDDLDTLGLLKVDLLALGMLSAIRRALDFVGAKHGLPPGGFVMQSVPSEDPATYTMLCRGDSVGTFQVESRAQMSMLPRLQPRAFYDLVIEVAIVRPGPIQGGMVHPYLRRRSGEEPVDYPSDAVRQALQRTLGVPIFQEQVMQLAILAADFTPGEADQLRRAMAAWKRKGGLGPFHERLVGRMVAKGYTPDYAERIFKQIQGFGEYGFPESHAASFALLVYVSAWLKCHHPDAFLAALLNSQPMGFYAPAQLVRDAREHGVTVLPVDITCSVWTTELERLPPGPPGEPGGRPGELDQPDPSDPSNPSNPSNAAGAAAPVPAVTAATVVTAASVAATSGLWPVRLGFSRISGFPEDAAQRLVAARTEAPFSSPEDLARRAQLDARQLELLAQADALRPLSGHRHQAAWAVAGVDTRATPMLRSTRTHEVDAALLAPGAGENLVADYRSTGLSLASHPLALLRDQLATFKIQPAAVLRDYPNGRLARASGLVTHRQRPETAKGVVFVTLEDETGAVNVICWPQVVEAQRRALLGSTLLTVYGVWQCEGQVRHLVARTLVDHSALLQDLSRTSSSTCVDDVACEGPSPLRRGLSRTSSSTCVDDGACEGPGPPGVGLAAKSRNFR
jgi:error-prone DNA polymerase